MLIFASLLAAALAGALTVTPTQIYLKIDPWQVAKSDFYVPLRPARYGCVSWLILVLKITILGVQ